MKLKSALVFSLVLNGALLTFVGVTMLRRPAAPAAVPIATNQNAEPRETSPAAAVPETTVLEPFRWSRLESADDAAYVQNLRLISCPELTVRDILEAAIGHRYDQKREALKAEQKRGGMSAVNLQDAMARLWDEQNDLLAKLFGTPASYGAKGSVARADAGMSTVLGAAGPTTPMKRSTMTAPLVFLEPDPSWGLSETQMTQWNQITDGFAQALGGTEQDPKSPAYHERWQEAQAQADRQLKTLFGAKKVAQWQMESRAQMPPPPGE